jgi:hypothetical protein
LDRYLVRESYGAGEQENECVYAGAEHAIRTLVAGD